MIESINITVTEYEFSIQKTRRAAIKDWVLFVLYTLVIYFLIFLFYFYLRKHIKVEYFILFSIAFFMFYFLINKKKLKTSVIRINRINGSFYLGDKMSFNAGDEKTIVLYEFAGELFTNSIGNLYINVGRSEHILYYGATDEQINNIKNELEKFFSEQIKIEKKMLY